MSQRRYRLWTSGLFLLGMVLAVAACGPSLSGVVALEEQVADNTTTAVMVNDKYLYSIQNDKLVTYSISDAAKPKRLGQQDSFKGPHLGMVRFGASQMLIMGTDGTVQVFDISSPESPLPIWGVGKTLKIKYPGPFVLRSNPLVMYTSPGDGIAIARIELGELTKPDADQGNLDAATTKIDGGGGGGILLPLNFDSIPVALYVGNKQTGKVDYWSVAEIEAKSAKEPKSSLDVKAGNAVDKLFLYTNSDNTRGYLVVAGSGGDLEYFDLGNEYNSVASPTALEGAAGSVPKVSIMDQKRKRFFTTELGVYEFTDFSTGKDFVAPALWGQPETRATIDVQAMAVHPTKDVLYVGESAGLRTYTFSAKSN